ncbi:hypothetical protein ACOA8Y_003760 [Serratia marcescens]|uniref:Fimbrial protein n=1 Tax=Serratia marcescens TaxID=615 RepID=A0AB35YXG3_SERMA|nr:hypothetical protein [Serratia marcescens]MBH3233358.1 hypothetical protein [Serratia marcescens]
MKKCKLNIWIAMGLLSLSASVFSSPIVIVTKNTWKTGCGAGICSSDTRWSLIEGGTLGDQVVPTGYTLCVATQLKRNGVQLWFGDTGHCRWNNSTYTAKNGDTISKLSSEYYKVWQSYITTIPWVSGPYDLTNTRGTCLGWGKNVDGNGNMGDFHPIDGTCLSNSISPVDCNSPSTLVIDHGTLPPGKSERVTKNVSITCSNSANVKFRLMSQSLSLGGGVISSLSLGSGAALVNTTYSLPVTSDVSIPDNVAPGVYSNSTVLQVDIQ